jgi:glycosyltransferase involved in cell wall biosynthesis
MRIAVVSSAYIPVPPPKYGGTEQVIYNLVKGLKEAGHEPILFAPADSQVDCEIIPIAEKSTYFGLTDEEKLFIQQKQTEAKLKTKELLRENVDKFDIIHSHGFDLIDFQDIPNLTTIHGAINFLNLESFEKRKHLYFVSISKNQQDSFPSLQYAGVAYNGLDYSPFPVVTEPEDYLCFLGRFDREKSPHLAIQLAIKMNIKIKLAGKVDFQGREYFENEIKPFLEHPLVEFLGELGLQDKIELVSKARCNLHPTSFREPFGLSVLEAAYCGTPTAAIARGAMPELIEKGRTGVLVEDMVEAYHHMQEVFEMDRNYIAQRARSLFNYTSMTKQYLVAYQKVIEVFHTKKEQENIIRSLLNNAKSQIEQVWGGDIKAH